MLWFVRKVVAAVVVASVLAVGLPLLAGRVGPSNGVWSPCSWDSGENLGWRTRVGFAEQWLFVDASAQRLRVHDRLSPVVSGVRQPAGDPAVLEGMGVSPCDLWETERSVPTGWTDGGWPIEAVREAQRQSVAVDGVVAVVGQGWPFRQFWYLRWVDGGGVLRTERWMGPVSSHERRTSSDAASVGLPLGVYWSGLFGNVFVWSLLISCASATCGLWRRWSRRRRGLCVVCAYAVDGLKRCPECGKTGASATRVQFAHVRTVLVDISGG